MPKETAMHTDKPSGFVRSEPVPFAGEPAADFRARVLRQQKEAAEYRQRELVEQASILNPPDVRIRIWERLHEIRLPRDAKHRLIAVIAANTGLSVEQVLDEQRNRSKPPAAPTPATEPELAATPPPPAAPPLA
jgi:hypothetical protein